MLVLGAWCVFQMTSCRQLGCRSQIQPCQLRAVGEKHIYLLYLPWVLTLLNTAAEKGTSHKNVFMNCIMRQDDKKWQLHSWSFQTGDINRNLA